MITKEQFISYERVRQSGVTNMFDIKVVSKLSGLSKEECFEIMRSYGDLNKKYPEVRISNKKP